jgi:hypothetical protein
MDSDIVSLLDRKRNRVESSATEELLNETASMPPSFPEDLSASAHLISVGLKALGTPMLQCEMQAEPSTNWPLNYDEAS